MPTGPSLGGAADRGRRSRPIRPGNCSTSSPVDGPVDVTEIAWDAADALPFPLCLSVEEQPGARGQRRPAATSCWPITASPLPARRSARCRRARMQLAPPAPRGLLRQAARRCRCRRASVRRWQNAPLSHGFDLAALLAVPISDDESLVAGERRCLPIDPRGATPLIAKLDRHARRGDRGLDGRAATCSAARPTTPRTSWSRSRTAAAPACASATTTTASGPTRAPRSPRPTASATASPAMSARRPSRMS